MKSIRVGILTSVHFWSDPRIFERQARSLAKNRYEVVLVARGAEHGIFDGVRTHPLQTPSNRMLRILVSPFKLLRTVGKGQDVIIFHDPELLILMLLSRCMRRKTKFIYDVHEDYEAQILHKDWIHPKLRKFVARNFARFESFCASRCSAVICATPKIRSKFENSNPFLVQNFPIVDSAPMQKLELSNPLVLIHVGALNRLRGVDVLKQALENLPNDSSIVVHQYGPTANSEIHKSLRFVHHDLVSHEEVLRSLATAHAGLILYRTVGNNKNSQPNKLFEYLHAGLPVLASNNPHWRDLVEESGGKAWFVDETDVSSVREGIAALEQFLKNSKSYSLDREARALLARACFNWESEEISLLKAVDAALKR